MLKPAITVIIPIRNRTGLRLENALRSLRWQTDVSVDDVEIILSDFGSDAVHAEDISKLGNSYNARVVRTETEELWNRSKALNVALQQSEAPISFCTDADMVFEGNFLATILRHFEGDQNPMVVCRCRDLPYLGEERLFEQKDYSELRSSATMRKAMGTGACQVAKTDWFRKVRGYDEKYIFWGFEDKDMVHRATKSGLALTWIHNDTSMLHQWHQTTRNTRYIRKQLNKIRFYITRGTVTKNRKCWGSTLGQ